jgi:hypothetical protein
MKQTSVQIKKQLRVLKFLFLLTAGVFISQISTGQEVIIIDTVMVVTKEHKGFSKFQPYEKAGLNWVSPHNYFKGTFHIRYEMIEYQSTDSMRLQVCIWTKRDEQGKWKEGCSPQIVIPGTGVVTSVSYPAVIRAGGIETGVEVPGWWLLNGVPVDWSDVKAFSHLALVIRCKDGSNMSPSTPPEKSCWEQHENYLPAKIGLKIVLVAENHQFSGWENY